MGENTDEAAIGRELARVRIVLVGTVHSGNIGAAARAMKNMGLRRLYLAAPLDFPHREATYRAVQATDVLEAAVVTASLEEDSVSASIRLGLTPACSGLAALAADARR